MESRSAPILGRLMTATLILGAATLGAGCGAHQPAPANPTPATRVSAASPTPAQQANSTLTGKWRDEKSNVYEFTSSRTDLYSGQVITVVANVCTPVNINVSANAGHFEGTMAFYKVVNGVCGEYLGDGTITVELGKAGSTAQVKWAGPATGSNCLNCVPHTWTRLT
jgi:hypothetical protein